VATDTQGDRIRRCLLDRVEELIRLFEREKVSEDPAAEYPERIRIIEELEEIQDPRVISFFVDVVLNKDEYDLARIEILRILRVRAPKEDEYGVIGRALIRVLIEDPDNLVKNYAAMALSSYMNTPGALEVVKEIVLDVDADKNLRYSAFGALEDAGAGRFTTDVMRELLKDDEMQDSAESVLNEWGVPFKH
jgi:hypothetical protein